MRKGGGRDATEGGGSGRLEVESKGHGTAETHVLSVKGSSVSEYEKGQRSVDKSVPNSSDLLADSHVGRSAFYGRVLNCM